MGKQKIFIGGFGGSGTRVVTQLLYEAGYWTGKDDGFCNPEHDFLGKIYRTNRVREQIEFIAAYDALHFLHHNKPLNDFLNKYLGHRNSFAIKHGHLMCAIPLLKTIFSNSKFILVCRHPIEVVNHEVHRRWLNKYHGNKNSTIQEKLTVMDRITRDSLKHIDLLIRLEDILFDQKKTIDKLSEFAQVQITNLDWIKPSESIGLHEPLKKQFQKHPLIQRLGY